MEKAKKKIVKIRRRKKGAKRNLYFHSGTHDAIVKFQQEESNSEKEKIYVADILPAFDKLVENLIFIHGFQSNHCSYEDLKSDCVTFLYETLHKFDHSRGTKAFSYFNVVAKNWLIIRSKQRAKQNKRQVSIDDPFSISKRDMRAIETYKMAPEQDERILKKESIENMFSLMEEIKGKLSSENEIACINAIICLFEKIDDLDLLNKRAIFVYLRDISNLNPKQLSIAMSSIRKHYKSLVKLEEFDIFF
jgi:hypothetical protein|tara:strand:- start:434 stop:1177 length:744 start_codon:yes stop_codon:yes gene_type:complete